MKSLIYGLLLLCSLSVYASDEHEEHDEHTEHSEHKEAGEHAGHDDLDDHGEHDDHGSSKAIGHGKAIEEVSDILGFKLSKDSLALLEISFTDISSRRIVIDRNSLVVNRDVKGVYRFRNGFFKFINAHNIKTVDQKVMLDVDEFEKGDQIATSKLDLIKVCDIYSTDTAEYGHAH
ncbi:MAG: hypothetical protein ACN6I6_00660 [bacterium]